jgi:hypothetical protein
MKDLRHILLCSISLLVASCAAAPDLSSHVVDSVRAEPSVEECRASGGAIRNVCRLQTPACVTPYSDAGKRCTDSRKCKGKCLLNADSDRPFRPGDFATGRCEVDNDPCGCKFEVVNGRVAGGQCVD